MGKYDKNAVSNLGSNRFTSRILFNYGLPFKAGKNWIDLYGSVRFFGKNRAYKGDYILRQKPLFGFEAHYSHDIAPKTWLGGGLIYGAGGSQRSNIPNGYGVQGQNSLKASAEFFFPAWKGASTFLSYNRTLVRPAGTPEVRTFILQFLHFVQFKKVKSYKKDPVGIMTNS
ncbi:hypothetical protein SAMN05444008_107187 [Cnuella takakiae]|uniref:Capsule assembly protein Wzi n=1 Tax=Cnuella takakiae TaxID=1302690 RepID=A0A1M5B7U6_9BACT|nr:hypothetical protein [Cnuella takakiae]OLY93370.1 hypothetical protein BUE76_16900 [Cnuella takakiae]SHF38594.1 hypothetical protein SAMN05444008_107187 [Cnuella takakiae]